MGVMYLQLFHILSSQKLFILNALKNFTGWFVRALGVLICHQVWYLTISSVQTKDYPYQDILDSQTIYELSEK